jgi:hypothetical protein
MSEQEQKPVLELSYLGYLAGWVDHACAFVPANEDQVYLNAAIIERLAA